MAKKKLVQQDLVIQTSLSTPDSGFVGFGAKSDGLYQKVGSSEEKLLTVSSTDTLTNKTLTDAKFTTTLNAQTGTTYTLVLADSSKLITLNNASAIAVTIPTNASVAFPIGTQIDLVQIGAGKVTFSGAGTTINSKGGNKAIGAQWVGVTLTKTDTDTWLLIGDLIA